jgi:XrtN system VIT domain protein
VFPINVENEEQLLIEPASMLITKQEGELSAERAPDHLYRLFAYNTILREAGIKSIQKSYTDTSLVKQAQLANIVTPLSSLIVLETKKDYDRFGIKETEGSLGNASMRSSGAVPEPHEWALIILIALVALFLLYKNRLQQLWAR